MNVFVDLQGKRAVSRNQNKHPRGQRFAATWLRFGLTALALLAQLVLFVMLIFVGASYMRWVAALGVLVSALVVAYILNSRMQIEYKLAWSIVILLVPLAGGVFYLLFGARSGAGKQMRRYMEIQEDIRRHQVNSPKAITAGPAAVHESWAEGNKKDAEFPDSKAELEQIKSESSMIPVGPDVDPRARRQLAYFEAAGPFIGYAGTKTTYYPVGDDAFVQMLEDLEKAKRWIGLEFFIVAEGSMLNELLEVLERKIAEGVKIFFMYDDFGSMLKVPSGFEKRLRKMGIKAQPINKFGPGLTLRYNNRDHRKLLVIDGEIGYTGGINIADEYVNRIERFGHWRDTVLRMEGPGVWGLATLYFSFWDLNTGEVTELDAYKPDRQWDGDEPGATLAFDDTPFDNTSTGWAGYRQLIMRAQNYVDLTTPYLVPSQEQTDVLVAAAKSGVRIRIFVPGIPDKKVVYEVTRSNYAPLLEAGIKIFEYSPGFLHAKQMVADDEFAIIGTINFDFRSFYLHQENAVWMFKTTAIADMAADFDELERLSKPVTLEEARSVSVPRRVMRAILRTFSPMM